MSGSGRLECVPAGGKSSLPQVLLEAPGGTVTEALEKYLGGPVHAVKLAEVTGALARDLPELQALAGTRAVDRRVLLCAGSQSTPVLHATSTILVDRLPDAVARSLLDTDVPIGKLLQDHGATARPEASRHWTESASEWRALLPSLLGDTVLCRSYRLIVGRAPAMLICERFPATSRL